MKMSCSHLQPSAGARSNWPTRLLRKAISCTSSVRVLTSTLVGVWINKYFGRVLRMSAYGLAMRLYAQYIEKMCFVSWNSCFEFALHVAFSYFVLPAHVFRCSFVKVWMYFCVYLRDCSCALHPCVHVYSCVCLHGPCWCLCCWFCQNACIFIVHVFCCLVNFYALVLVRMPAYIPHLCLYAWLLPGCLDILCWCLYCLVNFWCAFACEKAPGWCVGSWHSRRHICTYAVVQVNVFLHKYVDITWDIRCAERRKSSAQVFFESVMNIHHTKPCVNHRQTYESTSK